MFKILFLVSLLFVALSIYPYLPFELFKFFIILILLLRSYLAKANYVDTYTDIYG